jgi:hypothetical protein
LGQKRILCIAADPTLLGELGALASGVGAAPDCLLGAEALPAGPIPHRFVIAAVPADSENLDDLCCRMRTGAELVAVLPASKLSTFTRVLRATHCNHVIAGGPSSAALAKVVAGKLITGDIFGIEKYLPTGTDVQLTRLHNFEGRGRAIDEILKFADTAGVRRQIRGGIGQVCEELLMNALYDAPIDDEGRQIFGAIGPKERVDLSSPRPVSIRYAATPEAFLVAVRDRFGTLRKDVILDYIDKCLHATQQIDRKTYGAGLGLYLIANAATLLCVNIAPGMATEVICAFDRQKARSPLRMLSVFVHPGTTAARRSSSA